MLKLTEEETVYARQLFDIRRKLHQLGIEEATNSDRLASILRGHGVKLAEAGTLQISYVIVDSAECILVTEFNRTPYEV